MDTRKAKRTTTKNLGKIAVSHVGCTRMARALKKKYGHQKNFMIRDYYLKTSVITYYLKGGRKVRTISREIG